MQEVFEKKLKSFFAFVINLLIKRPKMQKMSKI